MAPFGCSHHPEFIPRKVREAREKGKRESEKRREGRARRKGRKVGGKKRIFVEKVAVKPDLRDRDGEDDQGDDEGAVEEEEGYDEQEREGEEGAYRDEKSNEEESDDAAQPYGDESGLDNGRGFDEW